MDLEGFTGCWEHQEEHRPLFMGFSKGRMVGAGEFIVWALWAFLLEPLSLLVRRRKISGLGVRLVTG